MGFKLAKLSKGTIKVKLSLSPYWDHEEPDKLFSELEKYDSQAKREL